MIFILLLHDCYVYLTVVYMYMLEEASVHTLDGSTKSKACLFNDAYQDYKLFAHYLQVAQATLLISRMASMVTSFYTTQSLQIDPRLHAALCADKLPTVRNGHIISMWMGSIAF